MQMVHPNHLIRSNNSSHFHRSICNLLYPNVPSISQDRIHIPNFVIALNLNYCNSLSTQQCLHSRIQTTAITIPSIFIYYFYCAIYCILFILLITDFTQFFCSMLSQVCHVNLFISKSHKTSWTFHQCAILIWIKQHLIRI